MTIPSRTREPVPGVESIRSDGYYVVLPPSRHPDGHRYRWRAPSWEAARLDELHPDLAEAILRPKKRHEPRDLRPVLPPPKGSWTPYGRAALAGCLKDILEAPEGLRHDTILATTLRLAALSKAGHLEWDLACRLVREAAARAGLHDRLRQAEVERLLRGAWDLAAPAEVR